MKYKKYYIVYFRNEKRQLARSVDVQKGKAISADIGNLLNLEKLKGVFVDIEVREIKERTYENS